MKVDCLQAVFDEEAAGVRVAGLAAGVCVDDVPVFAATHDVDDTTMFRIASVTKTFTALAVLQLVEQEVIGLDDPVNDHLRSVRLQPPAELPAVTVRHLLTHRAGLREPLQWTDLIRPARFIGPRVGQPVLQLPELYGGTVRAHAAAGDAWSYSNDGYALLGQLIEDVTGAAYVEYVAEHIWRPLGMTNTSFAPASGAPVALGHKFRHGRLRSVPPRTVVKAGAGGAYSSLADMMRYAAALADRGAHGLVRPTVLQRMYTPQVLLADRVPYTGLGLFLDRIGGRCVGYHPGDFPGYEAAIFVAPGQQIGSVALCNSTSRGTALRLARRLITFALTGDEDTTVTLDPTVAAELVGDYAAERGWQQNVRVAPMTGGRLSVTVHGRDLVLRSRFGPLHRPMALAPVSPDDPLHFRGLLRGAPYDGVPIDVVFARGDDGRVARLDLGLLGARFHRR